LSEKERSAFWDRIFDEPLAESFTTNESNSPQIVHYHNPFPLVDVHERENQLIVIMEIAGTNREQIELLASENCLVVKGRTICPISQTTIIQKERREGPFHREILLPRNIDQAKCKATFRNGLLFITFDFSEEL
jgi:HSP20 family protein